MSCLLEWSAVLCALPLSSPLTTLPLLPPFPVCGTPSCTSHNSTALHCTSGMATATELTSLVAQQLIDTRPSPTLELNRTLATPSPSPCSRSSSSGHVAPPSTPYAAGAASPSPASAVKRVPSPAVTREEMVNDASSPRIQLASPARRDASVQEQQQQIPVKQQQVVVNAGTSDAATSSPKGAKDIFSMSTDKQLSDIYKFVKEVCLPSLQSSSCKY